MANIILHTGATVSDIEWHKRFLLETLSMVILSDLPREGDWIDATTGLNGFQSQTVYITPDDQNRIELFQLFRPELIPIPLTYGSYMGISRIGISTSGLSETIELMSKYRLQLNFIKGDEAEGGYLVQDNSGLTWQLQPYGWATKTRSIRISHTRIIISDIEKSLPVYTDLLGLKVQKSESRNVLLQDRNGQWLTAEAEIYVLASDNSQEIEVCKYKDLIPLPNPRKKLNSTGLHHLAFYSENAHLIFSKLSDFYCTPLSEPQSIPMGPNKGGFVFYFFDPDGISLEILQTPKTK
jgi:catechol 2,3-dioxygenase-like lactoylglutathione lyase family enzyme